MQNNFIIHEHAQKHQWSGECFLSIKSFYNGKADYRVNQRQYQVDQNNFLILNECTKYRLTIDSTNEVESFCVFFSPEFVSQVASELSSSDEQILDFNPKRVDGIKLLEKNYAHEGLVSLLLKRGKGKSASGLLDIEKDEFYHQLLNEIIGQNTKNFKNSDRLASKKKSTREEIYQRILFVKDFIDCNYHNNLKLTDLAAVGLLSENHLLRNFNQIFGVTPFRYISQKRILEAKRQILESDKPIKDIASDVGYDSLGNFSHYFKAIVGKSPRTLRKR